MFDKHVFAELIVIVIIGAVFSLFLYNAILFEKENNQVSIQHEFTQILDILTIAAKESAKIDDTESGKYLFLNADNEEFSNVEFNAAKKTLTIDGNEYSQISDFKMEPADLSRKLWNIEITGTRKKTEQKFQTTVKLRNFIEDDTATTENELRGDVPTLHKE